MNRSSAFSGRLKPGRLLKRNNAMSDTIFQFKVALKEIQPPIWRRFQVRSELPSATCTTPCRW